MRYDIIIVGSGPGGYVAAIRAAQLGKKTALVERAEPGGVCLNWGCIPTKALLKSAQVYGYCKNAEHYGLELAGEVRPNLEAIVARSRSVAETMSKGVRFLLNKNKIDLIPGFGRLTAPGRIDVDGAEYEADHIVLATGARPREMAFMPIDGEHVISSRQALTLTRLPESMIVVGSGAIGSEFAWFYAALGVRVTIVEYMPRMMPLEDEEVSKTMERAFRKLRATVLTSTTVKAVKVNAEGLCEVEIEGKKGAETLTADVVLSAVGIQSNISVSKSWASPSNATRSSWTNSTAPTFRASTPSATSCRVRRWRTWLRPRPSAAWSPSADSPPRRWTTRPFRRASSPSPRWRRSA